MYSRPFLAVTMGDPAGVGPEIIVKTLGEAQLYNICVPVVIADPMVMEHAVSQIVRSSVSINKVQAPREAKGIPGTIDIYPLNGLDLAGFSPGKLDAKCGNAAFQAVKTAIELALANQVDGTVTAPLNKEAMHLAGHRYDGHTEIYAKLTGAKSYSMMLADGQLRVAHVTTHMPLVKVSQALTVERILNVIRLGHQACCNLGIHRPTIGVAGLNPHAGENGIFGTEEQTIIGPAVLEAQKDGMDVCGPLPPDTVFCRAAGGGFDLVVAMYHDQGHIPLKMQSFIYNAATSTWSGMTGVNVTLGLPIIRTSVDHGTAFENAGKNIASYQGMANAIEYAAMLAAGKKETASVQREF